MVIVLVGYNNYDNQAIDNSIEEIANDLLNMEYEKLPDLFLLDDLVN